MSTHIHLPTGTNNFTISHTMDNNSMEARAHIAWAAAIAIVVVSITTMIFLVSTTINHNAEHTSRVNHTACFNNGGQWIGSNCIKAAR